MDLDGDKTKSEAALREEKILEFWRENKIFSKTLEQTQKGKEFIFYEGPPTANAKPGIHHLEARAFKDAIPRYKTMQGYHVRRKGGWDTHGLPVELQVEKKLGLDSKKAIEEYGIAQFNQACKENVWEQIDNWTKFTERIGYWVDNDNPYVTYENNFMESVWNVIKKVSDQNLLYKDYKVVPWCPRDGTVLSSHEVAQGYEEVKDLSVYVKFRVVSSGAFPQSLGSEQSSATPSEKHTDYPPKYLLAWTTTPWTLPGNVALAVGKDIEYIEVKSGGEILILAKERLAILDGNENKHEVIATHKGSDLLGMAYEPLFPFMGEQLEKKGEFTEKAFKVYAGDFVNTTDGTGIVHTAVMYGQEDFELGTKVGLPKLHLVNTEGKFITGTGFLEGRYVKEVNQDGKPTLAVDIIEDLKKRNLFFKQENYKHQYPHCWRCKTPLIYYARDSWYIRMSDLKIKKELISENKKINWEPEHIRDGRFGQWLEEIKDWAISRERYWGTPLPVWICEKCEKYHVVGGIEDLKKKTKRSQNKYTVMRHGQAENNAQNIYSSDRNTFHLTEEGREQVLKTSVSLKKEKITKIYCSPFLRTKETAEIVAEQIGFPLDKIIYDERIRELEFGDFSGRPVQDYWDYMKDKTWAFDTPVPGGESFQDGKNRMGDFIYDIDNQNQKENILIISHGLAVEMIPAAMEAADMERSMQVFHFNMKNKTAALHREGEFFPLPHNENYELDLHRPYIDEIRLDCDCGGHAKRTKEVMDVWLDSGSMPFAQDHYPFSAKGGSAFGGEKLLFPADFISEGIDQTRGWFYTLHAVGILMGKGLAYKNVICLGHLLDDKGKKMSKSLGNTVDPWEMADKYGVDSLRLWMYSVNQPGESKNFDEKTVQLIQQQVFGLLYNVLAFYELYKDKDLEMDRQTKPKNILDQWILARLDELIQLSTDNLEKYKLLEPTRTMKEFIGDLSTWYLRRSRERIKDGATEDSREAKQTLYFVLKTVAKLLAPFAPFSAEDIWLKLRNESEEESVHLAEWPKAGKIDNDIISNMTIVRNIVSLGLEARQKAKIQVRQPLSRLDIKNFALGGEYVELIKDELNVKEVEQNKNLESDISLDIEINEELKQEGNYRELLRGVQDMRKKMGLTPSDVIVLSIETKEDGKNLIEKFESEVKKTATVSKIEFNLNDGEDVRAGELMFKIKITKND